MILTAADFLATSALVAAIWIGVLLVVMCTWSAVCSSVERRARRRERENWKRIDRETKELRRELDEVEWEGAVRVVSHKGHERIGVRR